MLLDADLKFINTDVTSLQDTFIQMTERGQIVGVGLDLSPHYSVALKKYREENPGTEIGSPGRYQVSFFIFFLVYFLAEPCGKGAIAPTSLLKYSRVGNSNLCS